MIWATRQSKQEWKKSRNLAFHYMEFTSIAVVEKMGLRVFGQRSHWPARCFGRDGCMDILWNYWTLVEASHKTEFLMLSLKRLKSPNTINSHIELLQNQADTSVLIASCSARGLLGKELKKEGNACISTTVFIILSTAWSWTTFHSKGTVDNSISA